MIVVRSKNGAPIRLTRERWRHIIERHPEMGGQKERLLQTLSSPELVQEGDHGTLIALRVFAETPLTRKYLAVVYRELGYGDGSVLTSCVEFAEPDLSGYEVLVRAGLSVEASLDSLMGPGVCSINGEGCPAGNCFCQCTGVPCMYWVYHHLVDGAWQYSSVGAGTYRAHNGEVEGWAWGEGSPTQGVQPPVIPFDQICAPAAPTDTPAPPTDTPPPADTPVPPTATFALPTSTRPAPTPVVWFRLDKNPIPAGECTVVRWDTSGANEVYLDGELVGIAGSRDVCPTCGTEYMLRVVSESGEMEETLVLGVSGTAAESSPTPGSTSAPAPTVLETVSSSSTPISVITDTPTPASTLDSTPDTSPSRTVTVTSILPPSPTSTAPATHTAMPTVTEKSDQTTHNQYSEQAGNSTGFPYGYVMFGVILTVLIGLVAFGGKLWR